MRCEVGYNTHVDHSAQTGVFLNLGSYQSGQMGLTVNQLRKLRRFESSTAHPYIYRLAMCILYVRLARVAQG